MTLFSKFGGCTKHLIWKQIKDVLYQRGCSATSLIIRLCKITSSHNSAITWASCYFKISRRSTVWLTACSFWWQINKGYLMWKHFLCLHIIMFPCNMNRVSGLFLPCIPASTRISTIRCSSNNILEASALQTFSGIGHNLFISFVASPHFLV